MSAISGICSDCGLPLSAHKLYKENNCPECPVVVRVPMRYPGGQVSEEYYDTCGYIDKEGNLVYPENPYRPIPKIEEAQE